MDLSNSGSNILSDNSALSDDDDYDLGGTRGGRLAAGGGLMATLALERALFKYAVDAAAVGTFHPVLLVPPYVAAHGAGFLLAATAARLSVRATEWRFKCLRPQWSAGAPPPVFDVSAVAASAAAVDGAAGFPRRQLAVIACLDVLSLALVFAAVARTPRALTVLLVHVALPADALLGWAAAVARRCRRAPAERAYLQAPSADMLRSPNNRHREALEMDIAAPPIPRHRVVAALLMTLALGCIFVPRLLTLVLDRRVGHHRRARHASRRLFAAVVYAASTVPQHASSLYKERALRAHAQPVAHCHLNAALAAWQLAASLLLLPAAYAASTAASTAYRRLWACTGSAAVRAPAVHAAAAAAWAGLADARPGHAPSLFVAHLVCGGLARLALGAAMRRGGDAVVYSAIAGAVPAAVCVLAFATEHPKPPAFFDAAATGLVAVAIVVYYHRPPQHSRFLTHWAHSSPGGH
ncbi:hypothetical protein M885DRAFT_611180 [Pelagophyceae sp. CCMP2097]|nr:hypothetical protein M885DRAFT_611180 [Pelagophyceae sp. CCMP2097]